MSELVLPAEALGIDELRKHILTNLEKTTLAKCARVCTLWSDDALDLLWEKLFSVMPLLSTVCPLVKDARDT